MAKIQLETSDLKAFLDEKAGQFNTPLFIESDPVSIPHQFSNKQDIEIMGFFAAILAWGQRKTIINKCHELIRLMDGAPYEFMLHSQEKDLKSFLNFKHRTFNPTDALYFIEFFRQYYQQHDSLEDAFLQDMDKGDATVEKGLTGFQQLFFSLDCAPGRTKKHIASPAKNSTCKRMNMFLRWMVRKDDKGVDFGIWNRIRSSQLLCPLDVHVSRVGRELGLIQRKQNDWKTVLELTEQLRCFDAEDPVKYDFALFGLGVTEKMVSAS